MWEWWSRSGSPLLTIVSLVYLFRSRTILIVVCSRRREGLRAYPPNLSA